MNVVLYFAAARAKTNTDREELDLAGKTVAAVREELGHRHPSLAAVLPHCRIAVDQTFVDDDHTVEAGQEVAVIPPVAGGNARVLARVLDRPLSVDEVLERVARPEAGAQVVLIGTVRDHTPTEDGPEQVQDLRYEAYAAMAEKVMGDIILSVEREIARSQAAVDHRVGSLQIGDRAVVVAASAPHRAEAFEACRAVIERLKADAPIWKHERRASGLTWVGLGP